MVSPSLLPSEVIGAEVPGAPSLEAEPARGEAISDREALALVPASIAWRYYVLPVRQADGVLTLLARDPNNVCLADELRLLLGVPVRLAPAGEVDLAQAIRRCYGVGAGTVEQLLDRRAPTSEAESGTEPLDIASGDEASVLAFVNQLLAQAVEDRATDMHVEPSDGGLRVRFRVDGILYDAQVPASAAPLAAAIAARIKIMAGLNVAERRLPQDGRIRTRLVGHDYDLRVSVLPTPSGESLTIRLLAGDLRYRLEDLGLSDEDRAALEQVIHRPHGLVFVTGPTGSGKTTTLYACLQRIDRARQKVITIEDPIEYRLDDVTQVQVHPAIGLDFARGLRSMLRHDPDIMMVGEVRDAETAAIAIRMALTGHLVLSTLHTNTALGAVARLMDMGIEPYLVASSVIALVAQRLVRLVCPACQVPAPPPGIVMGRGCAACRGTGYQGRTAIYEVVVVDQALRTLIAQRVPAEALQRAVAAQGVRSMRQDGWAKVRRGLTTPEEVLRVTQAAEEGAGTR